MPTYIAHAFAPLTHRFLLRLAPALHGLWPVRRTVHVERISLRTFAAFGAAPFPKYSTSLKAQHCVLDTQRKG